MKRRTRRKARGILTLRGGMLVFVMLICLPAPANVDYTVEGPQENTNGFLSAT